MALVLGLAGIVCAACKPTANAIGPPTRQLVGWRDLGSWSGRGNKQTESFTSETGAFRVQWETRNEIRPGAGTLKVLFRSGDSGNVIIEAVDAKGVDRDVEYVGDRPRWYYLTIESSNVDWTVSIAEPLYSEKPAATQK